MGELMYEIVEERDVYVTMRDGVRLTVNVFRPKSEGKFPVLLSMGPYGKDIQDLLIPPQPLYESAFWDGNIEAGDIEYFVPRGYVHIIADVRGTGKSEGEYTFFSMQEGKDGYDLVEWAAQQPWSNGNVGMLGYSYYAATALKTAIHQPPSLKAIFVSHIYVDAYRDLAYHGGILGLFLYHLWYGRHAGLTCGFAPRNAVSEMMKVLPKEKLEQRVKGLLSNPDIRYYTMLYHLLHYPQKCPLFFDIMLNPLDGPYWRERSIYPYYDKIKVPVYIVGKLAHEARAFWHLYMNVNSIKKLLVKPVGPEERPWREDREEALRWFDYWLKGIDTGIMRDPPIKLFVMGANEWRYLTGWPPKDIKWVKLYLRRWEWLSFAPELDQPEPDCYLYRPLWLSNKRDSVKYMTPPLPRDLEVMGPVAIYFYASIDQDDTNWIVRLCDVTPDGKDITLGKGYLKASHRAIDPEKSKPGEPYHPHTSQEPVEPGRIYEYMIALGVVVNVFKAGHRIKLEIESAESPRDPEMQIHFHPHLCSSKITLHKIYRNKDYQSHVLLPIVPKPGYEKIIETLGDDNYLSKPEWLHG
ncbi:MAG: CocE/NonD family hydrolase [Candidatus Bathyarchaeia archaeon]